MLERTVIEEIVSQIRQGRTRLEVSKAVRVSERSVYRVLKRENMVAPERVEIGRRARSMRRDRFRAESYGHPWGKSRHGQ